MPATTPSRLHRPWYLVDGRQLAHLMIQHGVGVTTRQQYELKRVDENYFLEGNG